MPRFVAGTFKGAAAVRTPSYQKPSKADAAWTHVYGTARAFVEWATAESIPLAITGLNERTDNQGANIRAVHECAAIFAALAAAVCSRSPMGAEQQTQHGDRA
jgi:hypothetical protein